MVSPAVEPTFLSLGLPEKIQAAIDSKGYTIPTPIQAQTIPHLLEGRDVLGQASTGTGKTAAFALPLLARLDLNSRATQVLVLAPTRELAIQVAASFAAYGEQLPALNVQPVYGGASYYNQIKELKRGVHVVVGTPGRVMDHMRRGTLRLDELKCLVLDEADEMLRMGFVDDVKWILEQTPPERQCALFSATLPDPFAALPASICETRPPSPSVPKHPFLPPFDRGT
jgi:ATP-dependent RNA helicase DeaD